MTIVCNILSIAEQLEELNADAMKRNRFNDAAYEWCKLPFNTSSYKTRLLKIYNAVISSQ